MSIDISVVITFHSEGRIAHRTLKSALSSIDFAEKRGASTEIIAVMDRVKDPVLLETLNYWHSSLKNTIHLKYVDFGSLSLSRNCGINESKGRFISILDGDDLYGESWLLRAFRACSTNPGYIAHPEFYFSFPIDPFIVHFNNHPLTFLDLMENNQWSALSMAHRDIFLKIPYIKDDETYAYQDWMWNCETAAQKYQHIIVPQTLMAIRQKQPGKSLWQNSFSKNKVVRPNLLFSKFFFLNFSGMLKEFGFSQNFVDTESYTKYLYRLLNNRLTEYLTTRHRHLHQIILKYKRAAVARIKNGFKGSALPSWFFNELNQLNEI